MYKCHCLQQFKISVNTEYMFAEVELTSSKSMKRYESNDLFDFFKYGIKYLDLNSFSTLETKKLMKEFPLLELVSFLLLE